MLLTAVKVARRESVSHGAMVSENRELKVIVCRILFFHDERNAMNNLIDIQSQIKKLQKQEADIRAREFDMTVQEILAKMQAFGITAKDLAAGQRRGAKGKAKIAAAPGKRGRATGKKSGIPAPIKFRGPNGETWSGRGLMPRWLSALVAAGQPRESFAIKAE